MLVNIGSFMQNGDSKLKAIRVLIEERIGPISIPLDDQISMEKDLDITGDEAWEFLLEYSKRFHVDISRFIFEKYFYNEGIDTLGPMVSWFRRSKHMEKHELKLGHLMAGIDAGQLNDEIIESFSSIR